MAVSGVKARLMLFEGSEGGDNNIGAGQKDGARPGRAVPPVLQKFGQNQQAAKDGDVTSPPGVSQRPKWGVKQNGTSSPAETGGNSSAADKGARKGSVGRLNIADKFSQGAAPPPIKPVVPFKKPADTTTSSEQSSEPDGPRPKVALKPTGARQLPFAGVPAGSKPALKPTPNKAVPGSNTDSSSKPTPPLAALKPPLSANKPVKLPSMDTKPVLKKSESPSSSSSSSADTNGPIDFRGRLRRTSGSFSAASGSTQLETNSGTNMQSNGIKGLLPTSSSEGQADTAKRRKSEEKSPAIVERQSDRKRFKKLDLNAVIPLGRPGPEKPALPEDGVDLDFICRQHATMLENLAKGISSSGVEDGEDIYDDGSSAPSLPMRPAARRAEEPKRQSNRVSLIPEMTAEEEGVDELIYDDGQTAIEETDLLYVDAASESKPSVSEPDDGEDIYEDEGSFVETEEEKKKRLKEEAKKQKEFERARLREEEKLKKKKKEDEKRRKQFKLTGDEIPVGEGTIKEDSKGRGVLTVKKGQMVTIIRIENNPVNKWLVKTDTDMGYVDSSNIEIDPNIIRQAMTNQKKDSKAEDDDDDDQPIYDDVAASEAPRSKAKEDEDIEDSDEIYECVQ